MTVEEPKRPGDWESWIDQEIREAQQSGKFDNLPGRGKPIDLTPNPFAQDQELAFKILRDAGYAPDWIELDKAIRHKLERARAALLRRWEWREARLQDLADRADSWSVAERQRTLAGWRDAVAEFELELAAINRDIAELNLKAPSAPFHRSMLDPAREVAALGLEAP
jgi:DnaJ homolog subfamily C member 28